MKKKFIKLLSATVFTTILVCSFLLTCQADTAAGSTPTADFEIDSQLWKALTEAGTFDYDLNGDGVVTEAEFAGSYGIQFDCTGYDIKDWSALALGTSWKYVSITNYRGGDLSVLNQLPDLYEVILTDCEDFSKVTGLETISTLTKLTVVSETEVNLLSFTKYPELVELYVTAPSITGYESLADIKKLDKLALSADTCAGIENYPDKPLVNDLYLSFKDFDDSRLKDLIAKHPYIKYLSLPDCAISSIGWVNDLERLFYLDIRNNMCRDIRPLLEHGHLHDMELYLKGNPWAPDSEDIIAKALLEIEDEYTVVSGDFLYLRHMTNPNWYCDLVGNLKFSVSDESIAYIIKGYSQLRFLNPGQFKLLVSNGIDVNLEYSFTVTGSPSPTKTPETVEPEPPIYAFLDLGDVNDDDSVTARDALMVLKYAAKLEKLGDIALLNADVNVDYSIDAGDALNILKYAADLLSSFEDIAVNTHPPVEPCPTETVEPTKSPTDYDNSFSLTIDVSEKRSFSPEDFPELNAENINVANMIKTETGYRYELLVYLNDETCTEEILEAAMAKAATFENVSSVDFNDYCKRNTIINLNYDEYEIKVGESISLYIDEYKPYYTSRHFLCLIVEFSEDAVITDELLNFYGISPENTINSLNNTCSPAVKYSYDSGRTYYIISGDMDQLTQSTDIDAVIPCYETYPTGNRNTEYWTTSDDSLISLTLSGGEPINTNGDMTRLDQLATITALKPGEVTVSVSKNGWGSDRNTGICKIKIVE